MRLALIITLCLGATAAFAQDASLGTQAAHEIGATARLLISSYFQQQLNQYEAGHIATAPQVQILQYGDDYGQGNQGRGKKGHKQGNGQGGGWKKNGGLPPGLARKGTLPPGIAKQLARNHPLPSGISYRQLPVDLERQLPPPAPGTVYMLADDTVLLVDRAKRLILDTLTVAAARMP